MQLNLVVYWAVDRAVPWTVDRAVYGTVRDAVYQAVCHEPPHAALADFLADVGTGAL